MGPSGRDSWAMRRSLVAAGITCWLLLVAESCQMGDSASYRGTVSVTETGKTCQRWDSQEPHEHLSVTPGNYPSAGLQQNYCRNPDGHTNLWCYTTDPDSRWEECNVPRCVDECATANGGCAHVCTDTPSSYSCNCRVGYRLMWDDHGCEVAYPPTHLTVTDITNVGFKITWSPSPDPDLQDYRVVTTSVNRFTIQTWLQVVGLTPETDYFITVTALVVPSTGRLSRSKAATTVATTKMISSTDLEFVNVTETTTMLRVTWVPPDAVVTGYRIMYGQEEATEQLNPSPGPGNRSALLEGLQPDTIYKVEIITIGVRQDSLPLIGRHATEPDECATENGFCDQICTNVPGSYRCFCRQGFVLMADAHGCEAVDPPMNLTVTDITDEGFNVTWSPSPDPDLQVYDVVVSKLDMTITINQSTDQTWFQVVGLTLETDYIIRATVLVLSDGRWAKSNVTTTETITKMISSTDLEFVNVTETTSTLRFTWVPPDAVVTGYRIMYGQEQATEQLNPSPGPGDRFAQLEGLQPDTMYKVEIITIGVRQDSLPLIGRNATEPDECATVNGFCDQICTNVPGSYRCFCRQGFVLMADAHGCGAVEPPFNLVISDVTDRGLTITWSPSTDPDLHGYRVVVSTLDMMTAVNEYTDQTSFPVSDLSPDSDYVIGVRSLFWTDGSQSQSEDAVIQTSTEMSSSTDLQFMEVTESTLRFTWVPPGAVVTEYRIMYGQEEVTEQLFPSPGPGDRSAVILGLQAGSMYKVEIITIGVRKESPPLLGHNVTEMSSSTDLQFIEVTETTLRFTWVPPGAVVTGYRIMYGHVNVMVNKGNRRLLQLREEATEQLIPSPGSGDRSALIVGLQPGVMYKVEIITIGVYRESAPLVGYKTTEATSVSTTSAASTKATSLMTTFFISLVTSTTPAETLGTTSTQGPVKIGEDQLDENQSGDTLTQATTSASVANRDEIQQNCTISPGGSRTTPADQAPGNVLDSINVESASRNPQDVLQRLAQNTALDLLTTITSKLDKLDMSDPSTAESVGGSLVDSVSTLLYAPEKGAKEDDGNPQSNPVEDDHASPEERVQKAEQKEEEQRAERKEVVQKSHHVLDDLLNAVADPMRPGAPPVTINRAGITLRAQKIVGSKSGRQAVQTGNGGFQFPSQTALFPEHPPHNVTVKLTQYQQNPYTWGHGEYQTRSSVMELSLHRKNYKPFIFYNLTENFIITIPGKSGNKPATKTITYPTTGNKTSSYHLLNLNNTAEGLLVTITPLNSSVIYGVSGRYGGRPDDQNYDVCTETYVLPEECSLMETLSGKEDTDKTEARIFIKGKKDPVDYYIKVQMLGPETKCDIIDGTDEKNVQTSDSYAYQIQWARLSCVFWSETQEAWRPDGCTISDQSTITSTICHCNHLTAFGSDFATPPNKVDFGALTLSDLRDNGAVFTTIFVEFCLFLLTLVIVKIVDLRSRRKKNLSINLDDLQNNFRNRLHLWTGTAKHAGTESTVAFHLYGDDANSGVRVVNITEKIFTQDSQVTLNFSTAEQLGNVELLQLMHDNSGEGSRASWNVDRAAVQDLTSGKLFYFICGEWLAADRGDGQVVKTFPVATEQDLRSFGFLFSASLRYNLAEEHLFLSVAIMPEDSTFTRSERLGCCLSLLLMSMVSSAMWLSDEDTTQVVQAVNLGPFSFTLNTVYTGIMTSITCLPVIIAIILLFQYSRPSNKGDRRVRDVETGGPAEAAAPQGSNKGLPHWCKYVAWVLVVLSAVGSAVFTVLYSLEWGKDKSERWLSAYFITFLADMFLMQPSKVTNFVFP
ncbi:FN1 [Branchiostoma lanceolatum]|uniref:FN1 protein n=1 Tax=Branchiostoma lanceolatum TaxID=7740 RepID=A0A8J9YRH0_BRALA|nr:FN1 [Branchiostoma lanceolatum]